MDLINSMNNNKLKWIFGIIIVMLCLFGFIVGVSFNFGKIPENKAGVFSSLLFSLACLSFFIYSVITKEACYKGGTFKKANNKVAYYVMTFVWLVVALLFFGTFLSFLK